VFVRSVSVDFVCCVACANRLRSVSSPPRGFGVWLCEAYMLGGYGAVGSLGRGVGLGMLGGAGPAGYIYFCLFIFFVLQKKNLRVVVPLEERLGRAIS
jgi:hypothetical protein